MSISLSVFLVVIWIMMRVVVLLSVLIEHPHGVEYKVSSEVRVEYRVHGGDLVVSDKLHDQEGVSVAPSNETDTENGHPGTEEGSCMNQDVVPETEREHTAQERHSEGETPETCLAVHLIHEGVVNQ